MNKNFITVYMLDGEYHSTQTTQVSYEWCIEGAVYLISNNQYKVSKVSMWQEVVADVNNYFKVAFLNSKP